MTLSCQTGSTGSIYMVMSKSNRDNGVTLGNAFKRQVRAPDTSRTASKTGNGCRASPS